MLLLDSFKLNVHVLVQIIFIFKLFLSLFELFQLFETPQVKNSSRLSIRCEGDLEAKIPM